MTPKLRRELLSMERFMVENQKELGIEAVGTHEREGLRVILWRRVRSHGWSAYDRATDDSPQVHVIRVPRED